jgi:chemotaxis methyl-accepting protein methylase
VLTVIVLEFGFKIAGILRRMRLEADYNTAFFDALLVNFSSFFRNTRAYQSTNDAAR